MRGMLPRKFTSVEDAWFWYVSSRLAANEQGRRRGAVSEAPVLLLDVDRMLLHLYRRKAIGDAHLVVGRKYVLEGRTPAADYPSEAEDARLWRELMDELRPYLEAIDAVETDRTQG